MNWVDWTIIALLAFGAVRGYSRGLVKSFLKAAGPIIGVTAAILYYQPLANWLNKTMGWSKTVSAMVENSVNLPTTTMPGDNPLVQLTRALGEMQLPPALTKTLVDQINQLSGLTVQSIAVNVGRFVAELVSRALINAVAFALIVLTVKVAADLIVGLLSQGLGIGGGDLDRLGGLAFGLLQSGLILAVVMALLAPLLVFDGFRGLAVAVADSTWSNWFIKAFYFVTQG